MTQSSFRASLLLLAYNQEAFIRDAIACAFEQDAQGLEIILSDDCSTDSTFDIMQEMTAAYQGPHRLRLNRNPQNLGVNDHINHLVEMAGSEVCIPFPGDDISEPNRVSRLLEVMEQDDALLVHSDAHTIDAAGNPSKAWHKMALFYKTIDPAQAAMSDALYLGATAAYRRALFDKYGPLPSYGKAYEDLITGFRAALEGRISYIDEKLLYYRNDVGISNIAGNRYRLDTMGQSRARRMQRFKARRVLFEQRLKDARTFGLPEDHEIVGALRQEVERVRIRSDFYDLPWLSFIRQYGAEGWKATLSELNYILKRK